MLQVTPAESDAARPAIAFVGAIWLDEPGVQRPPFVRAGQMFQDGLLQGLAAAGMPHDVLFGVEPLPSFPRTRRLFGRRLEYRNAYGQPVRLLPFLNVQPLKWLTAGLAVFAAIVRWSWTRRGQPRIAHCVNLTMPPGVFVWLAARLTGTKILVSVLDVFVPGALVPNTMLRRLDYVMNRWLLPRCDGVMVVSDAIAQDLLPGRRVCLIDGGLFPHLFTSREFSDTPERRGPFRIVLSGSLEFFNGIELALAAVKLLPPGYQIIFAGAGSQTDKVLADAATDPRVVYCGSLPFNDLLDLYRCADLLLNVRLTQDVDTRYFFPSKLMELLASGTPVLSTCTGHVEAEYGDLLYLLRRETPEALAARILEIAAIPPTAREDLGRRARQFALAEKTWERQAHRLARYIRSEVLEGR